ncbi:hypothetical protein JHK85_054922 [Glycine max]|nr:hypothetical protein JHK86_053965 [Glycine max]KAG4928436.1 hypothetical protein JHK85_054922 [Glycine max]
MWNLATKKFKLIPPGYAESVTPYCVLLVTYQGFGYDHATNDYKVFRYLSFFPRRSDVPVPQSWKNMSLRPLWEIYSLRSKRKLDIGMPESWTKTLQCWSLPWVDTPIGVRLEEGDMHPIGVGKKGNIFFRKNDGELVSFDLSSLKIEELGIKGKLHCCQTAGNSWCRDAGFNKSEKWISLQADGQVVLTPDGGQEASSQILPINFDGLAKSMKKGDTNFIGQYLLTGSETTSVLLELVALDKVNRAGYKEAQFVIGILDVWNTRGQLEQTYYSNDYRIMYCRR